MKESSDLTKVDTHFAFGENWASYAEQVGEPEIAEAVNGLRRLFGNSLANKSFLDIGCGSGLHSLAALHLGVREILATDIDAESVRTTRAVVRHHPAADRVDVRQVSVFDLTAKEVGMFDVVYSWGVLHHTGDMYRAIRSASMLVGPRGVFALALYRKTWMCWFWRWEKRVYARSPAVIQSIARSIYIVLYALGKSIRGANFRKVVRDYRTARGMDFYHDVHDWLGGYPYESISPKDVDAFMRELGFECRADLSAKGGILGRYFGLFGSGCDEYLYQRTVG